MDVKKTVEEYINRASWRASENANIAHSAQGLNLHVAGEAFEEYLLQNVYPEELGDLHKQGFMHIHDMRSPLVPYCVGWDLADLVITGFGGGGGIKSGPPKHLSTALMQLVNFMFTLQCEAAGAVAVSNWDTLLAPFVREDNLTYVEVKQAVQEFVFNMNVPTRVGSQPPFSNLSLDIVVPSGLAKEPAIVGGKPMGYKYASLKEEMGMLQRAFFEVMNEGDHEGRPFTFPIPTIDINHDFPWTDRNLDAMWECTAKYGIPYFANYLSTDMDRDDVRSMCCRLRLDTTKLPKKGGVFNSRPLTGSLGVVTINLARAALTAKEDFMSMVESIAMAASMALVTKRAFIDKLTDIGLYPYSQFWLRGVKEEHGSCWAQHYQTLGVVGMHEACLNLGIEGGITSKEGRDLAISVLEMLSKFVDVASEKFGLMFNLEATPAEGACHRLAQLDIAAYDNAHYSGTKDAPYYTQATSLPVSSSCDIWEVLEHQSALQSMYTGGTVLHMWAGERVPGVRKLIQNTFENYPIPYVTVTPTFSICESHGYIDGEHVTCPTCDKTCQIYSRVVGYLQPLDRWNPGKKAEFQEREMIL